MAQMRHVKLCVFLVAHNMHYITVNIYSMCASYAIFSITLVYVLLRVMYMTCVRIF